MMNYSGKDKFGIVEIMGIYTNLLWHSFLTLKSNKVTELYVRVDL